MSGDATQVWVEWDTRYAQLSVSTDRTTFTLWLDDQEVAKLIGDLETCLRHLRWEAEGR